MNRSPFLVNLTPFSKLLILVMIIFTTYLFTVLIGFLVGIPFFGNNFFESMNAENLNDPAFLPLFKYFQVVSQLGMFIFPTLVYAYVINQEVPSYLLARCRPDWLSLIVACCVVLVSMPLISWLIEMNMRMQLPAFLKEVETWMKKSEDQAETLTEAFLATRTWGGFAINMLMIAILPSLGEEMLFRGVLIRLFREWTKSIHWGVIISAILFSSMHFQFYGFIPRFMLGLILGYAFVWTGNLWIAVAGHFVNNATAVMVSFLYLKGMIATDYSQAGSELVLYEVLISGLVTILFLWIIYQREQYLRQRKEM